MTLAARIAGYILAAFLAFMAVQKFIADVPIFKIIAANTGQDWVEPWFKWFTGALEIIAAILLVAGWRVYGGALSTLILVGAVIAHLTVLGVVTPMSSAPDAEKSPMLFIMALVFLAVSAFVVLASRPRAPAPG